MKDGVKDGVKEKYLPLYQERLHAEGSLISKALPVKVITTHRSDGGSGGGGGDGSAGHYIK